MDTKRLRQYISKASFANESDRMSALQCLETIIPTDADIARVAHDESQKDWNDLHSKNIYIEAFIDGAKWMKSRLAR